MALNSQLLCCSGADAALSPAAPVDADLVNAPELSCEDVELTDTLLGNGQYGQTMLVSSETTLQNDLHNIRTHCMPTQTACRIAFWGPYIVRLDSGQPTLC